MLTELVGRRLVYFRTQQLREQGESFIIWERLKKSTSLGSEKIRSLLLCVTFQLEEGTTASRQ